MITAVIMVGESGGPSEPVAWMNGARRAAARDLIEQVASQPPIDQIVWVSPEQGDADLNLPVHHFYSQPGPVHVGDFLADVASRFSVDRLLYFGGGSAPLLDDKTMRDVVSRLAGFDSGIITNNRFASDWAGVAPASSLHLWKNRLPKDNMIGWVLSAEAGLPIHCLPASAASRLDIDTPTDILTLRLHRDTKRHLRRYLSELPLDTGDLESALAVLATPASQVFVAGRLGPDAWQALNHATTCWLRVVSEERGMVSSGRYERGEVYSFLADHITKIGMKQFFSELADHSQAALIDSRVLLAHYRRYPTDTDRFASDFGLVDQIQDPWLQEFTRMAKKAPIPVVLGGHGLMSGDLFAFSELL